MIKNSSSQDKGHSESPEVASENTLRAQISKLVHDVKHGKSMGSTRTVNKIVQLFAEAIETAIKDCTYRYNEDQAAYFEAVDKEKLEQRLAEMVDKK